MDASHERARRRRAARLRPVDPAGASTGCGAVGGLDAGRARRPGRVGGRSRSRRTSPPWGSSWRSASSASADDSCRGRSPTHPRTDERRGPAAPAAVTPLAAADPRARSPCSGSCASSCRARPRPGAPSTSRTTSASPRASRPRRSSGYMAAMVVGRFTNDRWIDRWGPTWVVLVGAMICVGGHGHGHRGRAAGRVVAGVRRASRRSATARRPMFPVMVGTAGTRPGIPAGHGDRHLDLAGPPRARDLAGADRGHRGRARPPGGAADPARGRDRDRRPGARPDGHAARTAGRRSRRRRSSADRCRRAPSSTVIRDGPVDPARLARPRRREPAVPRERRPRRERAAAAARDQGRARPVERRARGRDRGDADRWPARRRLRRRAHPPVRERPPRRRRSGPSTGCSWSSSASRRRGSRWRARSSSSARSTRRWTRPRTPTGSPSSGGTAARSSTRSTGWWSAGTMLGGAMGADRGGCRRSRSRWTSAVAGVGPRDRRLGLDRCCCSPIVEADAPEPTDQPVERIHLRNAPRLLRLLGPIALLGLLGVMLEDAAQTWSTVYLVDVLGLAAGDRGGRVRPVHGRDDRRRLTNDRWVDRWGDAPDRPLGRGARRRRARARGVGRARPASPGSRSSGSSALASARRRCSR